MRRREIKKARIIKENENTDILKFLSEVKLELGSLNKLLQVEEERRITYGVGKLSRNG